ncbi:transcriptional repressor LexA [bacterium]|nr:transcriptional repressor LexA [bacterium]
MTPRRSDQTRREIFAFVRDRIAAGAPPTVREVQRAFGFKAVQSAQQHLAALVAAGRLEREPGVARGYRLPAGGSGGADGARPTGPVGAVRYIPLLGRVQAGALQEAIEDPDGWLPASGPDAGAADDEGGLFALTVRGESMVEAGILPGDMVVVHRQDTARDGEIVVALVEGEATVKRLRLRAGRIVLQPENAAFAPIEIAPDTEIRILGRVVEVRRRLA